jgi:hypothetical protein
VEKTGGHRPPLQLGLEGIKTLQFTVRQSGGAMRRLHVLLVLCFATTTVSSAETHVFPDAQKSFWSLQPVLEF